MRKWIQNQSHFLNLAEWLDETDCRINYRRFFIVNRLICLNIQNPVVFEHIHELGKNLLKMGIFQGLRVDPIDGLHDPSRYLE